MARQAHTTQALPTDTNYAGATLTWTETNSTPADGESVVSTGKDLILAFNSSAGALTATITSSADSLGRTRTMSLAVAAGAYAMFGPFRQTGWQQTDGNIYFSSTATTMKWAVLRLPAV